MENNISDISLDIITKKIAELMDEYAFAKDNDTSKSIKEKLKVLENIKEEIYHGNISIMEKVIEKEKRGIL